MQKITSQMCAALLAASAGAAFADTRTSDTTNPNTPPQQSVDKLHQQPDDTSSNMRNADGSNAKASNKDIHELRKKSETDSKAYQSKPSAN